jgi:hypothetical protein
MLLANIAWILASNGRRVLVVDWDLEAPGMHRYLRPFLDDRELTGTDGVIDFVVDFCVAATTPVEDVAADDVSWFEAFADLTRYATEVRWDFADDGQLHFIGAGRQSATYSTRVNEFNWQDFYDRFGGGALLDRAADLLRRRYDYVLIDSRTGVSDTSGVCTVQLPDVLVVCFTLNNQSIEGASAVARSVRAQRAGMEILPVPMRIERSEKDKLDLRRTLAFRRFGALLAAGSQDEHDAYWSDVEVLYEPYYAYEEVLATFKDRPGQRHTLLASAERLTARIAGAPLQAVRVSESRRQAVLTDYEGVPLRTPAAAVAGRGGVLICYRRADAAGIAARLYDRCAAALGSERTFMDVQSVMPGEDFVAAIENGVRAADVVVVLIGPRTRLGADPDDLLGRQVTLALELSKFVIPVLVDGAAMPVPYELPVALQPLAHRQAIALRSDQFTHDVDRLLAAVELATSTSHRARSPVPSAPSGEWWGAGSSAQQPMAWPPRSAEPSWSPQTSAKSGEVIEEVLRQSADAERATTWARVSTVVAIVSVLVAIAVVLLVMG